MNNDLNRLGRLAIAAWLVILLGAWGCAGISRIAGTQGGALGALQSADDALAARYGVPKAIVSQMRTILGIPDARTLPDASRVLPAGWAWRYDLLDASNRVVDVSLYHWDTVPRVHPTSTNTLLDVFGVAPGQPAASALTLEGLLQIIQANPGLLDPAE